jgi:tetratricopeptide (TPR) repeat protein
LSTDKEVLEEAYHVLAITHEALGLTDELLADLDWLITHKLASGGIYAWRGLYKTRRGQNEEALEDLTMALQLSPGTDNYLLQRANVYEQLERYDEEISDVNAVLDHTRTNDMFKRTLYLKRATAFFKLGNKAQAYADFDVAVRLGATPFVTNAAEYFRAMKT